MPLPFMQQNIQLPNNYAQARKLLTGFKKSVWRPLTGTMWLLQFVWHHHQRMHQTMCSQVRWWVQRWSWKNLVPCSSWGLPPAKVESTRVVRLFGHILKASRWMTNFFRDQILLVTCQASLPDSGRRTTPLWRTLRRCSFKLELERNIKVFSDFCGG